MWSRGKLTQLNSVRLLSVSSTLLGQGGKGHCQDVFALPCALTSPGYLGQLHTETEPELSTEHLENMNYCITSGNKGERPKPPSRILLYNFSYHVLKFAHMLLILVWILICVYLFAD